MDIRMGRSIVVAGLATTLLLGGACASGHGHRHGGDAGRHGSERGQHGEEMDEEEGDEENEEGAIETVIALSDAPTGVQAAFRNVASGAAATRVVREVDDGVTTFEIEYSVSGKAHSIHTTDAGEMLEIEADVDAAALPSAVANALHRKFPDARVSKAESVQSFGYELKIVVDGKEREITVDANGDIEDED